MPIGLAGILSVQKHEHGRTSSLVRIGRLYRRGFVLYGGLSCLVGSGGYVRTPFRTADRIACHIATCTNGCAYKIDLPHRQLQAG